MVDRKPQLRTNLSDPVYAEHLDKVLNSHPTLAAAGLINTRYLEGNVRIIGGQSAPDLTRGRDVALTSALFAPRLPETVPDTDETTGPWRSAVLTSAREACWLHRLVERNELLLIVRSAALDFGADPQLANVASAICRESGGLANILHRHEDVVAAALVDAGSGEILDTCRRPSDRGELMIDGPLARALARAVTDGSVIEPICWRDPDDNPIPIQTAEVHGPDQTFFWSRMPFAPDHVQMLTGKPDAQRAGVREALRAGEADIVRLWIAGLLGYGIETIKRPRPQSREDFLSIIESLQKLDNQDLLGRLAIRGFADRAVDDESTERCRDCIYYLSRSGWCDLPERPLPVEPGWWCRLWTA